MLLPQTAALSRSEVKRATLSTWLASYIFVPTECHKERQTVSKRIWRNTLSSVNYTGLGHFKSFNQYYVKAMLKRDAVTYGPYILCLVDLS